MEFRNELAYGKYWHPYDWLNQSGRSEAEYEISKIIGSDLVANLEQQFTGGTDYLAYLKEDIEAIDKSRRLS